MIKSLLTTCFLVFTILSLFFNVNTSQSIQCFEVQGSLYPCVTYITGPPDINPSPACCSAVDNINREATTTQNRRDLCVCIKSITSIFSNVDPSKYINLPQLCNVVVPVPLDPNTDCTSIP